MVRGRSQGSQSQLQLERRLESAGGQVGHQFAGRDQLSFTHSYSFNSFPHLLQVKAMPVAVAARFATSYFGTQER
jgi:hypothetical protein